MEQFRQKLIIDLDNKISETRKILQFRDLFPNCEQQHVFYCLEKQLQRLTLLKHSLPIEHYLAIVNAELAPAAAAVMEASEEEQSLLEREFGDSVLAIGGAQGPTAPSGSTSRGRRIRQWAAAMRDWLARIRQQLSPRGSGGAAGIYLKLAD